MIFLIDSTVYMQNNVMILSKPYINELIKKPDLKFSPRTHSENIIMRPCIYLSLAEECYCLIPPTTVLRELYAHCKMKYSLHNIAIRKNNIAHTSMSKSNKLKDSANSEEKCAILGTCHHDCSSETSVNNHY